MTLAEQKRKPRMTVAHVASHAGVSRAAVYAVLNKNKKMNIGVSESTRAKVLAAIDELGYIPNETARTLVSNRSRIVGMIQLNSDSELAMLLSRHVSRMFLDNGIMVIHGYSENDPEQERELLRSFLARSVDCLLCSRLNPSANPELLAQYRDYGVPVIRIAKDVAFNEPRVMELAAEHAAAIGARRIAYLGHGEKLRFSSNERLNFLKEALKRHPELSFACAAEVGDYAECAAFVRRLKDDPDRPDLVVCYNDRLAELLLHALAAAGIPAPGEIGVIGVDGYPRPFHPMKLTSVRLPVERMAEALWDAYSRNARPSEPVLIEPELMIGHSTAFK